MLRSGVSNSKLEAKKKSPEIWHILDRNLEVFKDIPKGLSSSRGFEHMVELEPVKTLMFGPERVIQENSTLGQKRMAKNKLMFRSSATNSKFEVVSHSVLAKKMTAIIWKEEVEWGCVDTPAKGGSTLHSGKAKEQPFEVQSISDRYRDVFGDCLMRGEGKSEGQEVVRSILLSILVLKEEHSNLEDLEGSTTHPNQAISASRRNVQPIEELGGATLGHGGAGDPTPAILEVLLPTLALQEAGDPTPTILEVDLPTLSPGEASHTTFQ